MLEGDKLYGRGGADDGYAIFGSLTAIRALQEQKHAARALRGADRGLRGIGSYDLPSYVDHLAARIGKPSLVVCLDSGCGNYDQLWLTTSLRGLAGGNLTVQVLNEGVHSGDASGIVPSSFRILRQLLSRLEDEDTGAIKPQELLRRDPGAARRAGASAPREVLGDDGVSTSSRSSPGMQPMDDRPDRAGAQPHLAPGAVGHRHRRPAGARSTPATCCARTPR